MGRHLPYVDSDHDQYLPRTEISGRRAEALIVLLKEYMFRYLGVNTTDFFDTSRDDTLWNNSLPMSMYPKNEVIKINLPHYWVYSSPKNALSITSIQPAYAYFSHYNEALSAHETNLAHDRDSYIKGASGSGSKNNMICASLFSPNCLYGLSVAAHEPLHRVFGWITDYDLQESLVTSLTSSILRGFVEIKEWQMDTHFLQPELDPYLVDDTIRMKYFRLATFKLQQLYARPERVGYPYRLPDEEEFLRTIRRDYIIFADTTNSMTQAKQINNAWLLGLFHYTSSLIIDEYFAIHSIDPLMFLKNKVFQKQVLPGLRAYFESRKTASPPDLQHQFEEAQNEMISRRVERKNT